MIDDNNLVKIATDEASSAVVFKQTPLTHNSYPSDAEAETSRGGSAQEGIHRTTADNCDDVALGEENMQLAATN